MFRGFKNPSGSPRISITPWMILRYVWSRMIARPYKVGTDLPVDHVQSREEVLEGMTMPQDSITWLGHAAFLLRLQGTTILTDPFLWGSAGPAILRSLRRVPLPIGPNDLPPVDVLLISHGHEDHLHRDSIRRLPNKSRIAAVVPLGLKRRMEKLGIRTTAVGWHESLLSGHIRITAVPAIHYSEPGLNRTLWAGFVIEYPGGKIFFSGDTGYGPLFRKEIARYGPFDTAIVGVGAYFRADNPNSETELVHATPEEAVRIARDVNAKSVIGMHWGTARSADESAEDVRSRFTDAATEHGFRDHAHLMKIGETRALHSL